MCIRDRQHSDPGRPRRTPGLAVAGALAGLEILHGGDVGAQRERRSEAALGGIALERVEAVDGDAAAGHVEVGAALAEDRGAAPTSTWPAAASPSTASTRSR